MTDRLWRHQAKLNRRAESDPLCVRLVSARDVRFPPRCPVCGAPAGTSVDFDKRCRFTVPTHDGPAEAQQTTRLAVFLCASCAERHAAELAGAGRRSALETSVSRAIEYRVNPYTDALAGTAEPAWHGFCFRSADYAAAFRELNATLAWTPGRFARTSAAAHRSNMLQLIILIAVAAALALWAFLTRRP